MRRRAYGFSLIELALVIVLLGILAAGAVTPLRTQLELRDRRRTEADLDHAVLALQGFAMIHGRLPCPDPVADGAGQEVRLGARACLTALGFLPHVSLGVAPRDAWGRRYRYHLSAATSEPASGGNFAARDDGLCDATDGDLDLCARGQLHIDTRGDDPLTPVREAKARRTLANQVPAVVFSTGRDGPAPGAASSAAGDQAENLDGDLVYLSRGPSAAQPGCSDEGGEARPLCHYDDLLRWLSPTVLIERLVRAGVLP